MQALKRMVQSDGGLTAFDHVIVLGMNETVVKRGGEKHKKTHVQSTNQQYHISTNI